MPPTAPGGRSGALGRGRRSVTDPLPVAPTSIEIAPKWFRTLNSIEAGRSVATDDHGDAGQQFTAPAAKPGPLGRRSDC